MKQLNSTAKLFKSSSPLKSLKSFAALAAFAFAIAMAFVSCENDDDDLVRIADNSLAESRTILVYMVAENSLSPFVDEDLNEMVRGMDNATLNPGNKLLVYVDDTKCPRIYCITNDGKARNIGDITPEVEYADDCNSASADRLGEIIDYMLLHHPAESYGLVMWSHASGWIPSTYSGDHSGPKRSFGIDNNSQTSSNTGHQMDISAMARAIEGRCRFDFIFFDACFMQCIEVDYELRRCADYIIGSPAEIPGPGADYSVMMRPMFKERDFAQLMVEYYFSTYSYSILENDIYGVVISAVNTSAIERFADYMAGVCDRHRGEFGNFDPSKVLCYFRYNRYNRSNMPDFMDMKGIMATILPDYEYDEWLAEFDKVVQHIHYTTQWTSIFTSETHVNPDHCGGVSMFVPIENRYSVGSGDYNSKILQTQWGQAVWQ